jgi:hypothetical protein
VNLTTYNSPAMASNLFADTTGFSSRRGSNDWLRTDNQKSDTRAIAATDPNNRLEYMKTIIQTANVDGKTIPLREVIPFWFAVSSPLLGMFLGLLGAWFVARLSA